MSPRRVLLAEDNDAVRDMLQQALKYDGFEVVTATNVTDALKRIATENFDVLLSDLHMPDPGDGFTIVSAMRHTHPEAVTLVLSGYPALDEAMSAILSQADEVLTKPIELATLRETINNRLGHPQPHPRITTMSVASVLEKDLDATIHNWIALVDKDEELACIPLNYHDRTGHLPRLLRDLIYRLRLTATVKAPYSIAAREHGELRRRQGYTAALIVEESRILLVSIFSTIQSNLSKIDFSKVLLDVITIADEVDSQLKQQMLGYSGEGLIHPMALTVVAKKASA